MKTRIKAVVVLNQYETRVLANVLERVNGSRTAAVKSVAPSVAPSEGQQREEREVIEEFLKRKSELDNIHFERR